jgi:hypothetical protein
VADARDNAGQGRQRRQTVGALAGLALGVAAAGAVLLPRLQAEVPSRPVEPPARVLGVEKTVSVPCHLNLFRYRSTNPSSTCWFHALKKSPWPEN